MDLVISPAIKKKIWELHRVSEEEAQEAWSIFLNTPEPRHVSFDSREHIDPIAEWILVRMPKKKGLLKLVWIESEILVDEDDDSTIDEAYLLSAYWIEANTKAYKEKSCGVVYGY